MRRILEDLFFGNIDPSNKEFCQGTPHGEAMRAVAVTEEKLLALLDGNVKLLFEAHVSAQSDLVLQTALEHFISGFRLGARMAAEVFLDGDERGLMDIGEQIGI